MTKTEILENNKLIVEFMKYHNSGTTDNSLNSIYRISILGSNTFHTIETMPINKSWDWLMPIVEKIENIESYIMTKETMRNIRLSIPNIDLVYHFVIEFIKWYNNERKSIS